MTHEAEQHRMAMRTFHMNEATIRTEGHIVHFQFATQRRVVQSTHVQDSTKRTSQETSGGDDETEESIEKDVEVQEDHESTSIVERQDVEFMLEKDELAQDHVQEHFEIDK